MPSKGDGPLGFLLAVAIAALAGLDFGPFGMPEYADLEGGNAEASRISLSSEPAVSRSRQRLQER